MFPRLQALLVAFVFLLLATCCFFSVLFCTEGFWKLHFLDQTKCLNDVVLGPHRVLEMAMVADVLFVVKFQHHRKICNL